MRLSGAFMAYMHHFTLAGGYCGSTIAVLPCTLEPIPHATVSPEPPQGRKAARIG